SGCTLFPYATLFRTERCHAEGVVDRLQSILHVRNPGGVAALLLRDPHELPVVEADGMEGSSGVRLEEALEMAGDGFDVPMVGGATHVACRRPYGRLMLKQPLRNGVGDHPNVGVAGLLANHVGQ